MSKLTPPAPQNLNRRLQFFIDNPSYPGAGEKIQTCRRLISARNAGFKHPKRKPARIEPVHVLAPAKDKPKKPGIFSGLSKLFAPRTMSGGISRKKPS